MTLKTLNHCLELRERLDRAYEMVENLRDAATPGAQNLSGMPHAQGVSDKVGDLAAEIADLRTRIEAMEDELEACEDKVSAFADSLTDERLVLTVRLRYIKGLTWEELSGVTGINESTARKLLLRHVDSG